MKIYLGLILLSFSTGFVMFSCAVDYQPTDSQNWSTGLSGKADIYGEDSRREINDPSISEEVLNQAESVALVFNLRKIVQYSEEKVSFYQATMSNTIEAEEGAPLCEDEAFSTQVAPGYCTAFLISPTLVATAGHCINRHTKCHQMGFAFDFAKETPSDQITSIPRNNYYKCENLLGRLFNPYEEPEKIEDREYWYDWAVIQLDRPVLNRKPLRLTKGEPITRGSPLYVIGHPSGLPMKYTEGAVVSDDRERYMNTTLDIFQGNSGSPVFDPYNHDVHGIVIRGSGGNSFERVSEVRSNASDGRSTPCMRSKQCDNIGSERQCVGNHVLRINPLIPFLTDELQMTEHHQLINRQVEQEGLGFEHTFNFENEGQVHFATVHLNAHVRNAKAIKVILRHNDQESIVIHKPQQLPYGRWTATTFEFDSHEVQGDWTISIIEEEEAGLKVEWAQVMLGFTEENTQ